MGRSATTFLLILASAVALDLRGVARSNDTHASAERLAKKLQAVVDKHSSFWNVSLSFAIHNDSMEVAVASGRDNYADPSSMLSANSSIPMGSVTKMFTAVSVLRLAAKGEIHLDQKLAPLIDRYLGQTLPCSQMPSFCDASCFPFASCFNGETNGVCAKFTAEAKATCSYCVRYLHCHCDGTSCPRVLTTKTFWDNEDTIEDVTFRQLIGMTSGVSDYYFDPTNWLMTQVLTTTRDVEPLEFLAHMNKTFLFEPGSGRASYSTNGFSLVGLALAGHFNLTDWADLNQHDLAWGEMAFSDDQTLFPKRGACSKDARIAHQYASPGTNRTFFDLLEHSCINSWMGGNLAARPLDVARFTHKVFTGQLLDEASLKEMTSLHPITDGFASYSLAYGLGLEASYNGGNMEPLQVCGMEALGHGGEDYGSGSPLSAYMPKLKLGVSFAVTSAPLFGASPMGMNCSLRYELLGRAPSMALNDLLNAVTAEVLGTEPTCDATRWEIPSNCKDESSIGTLNGQQLTCTEAMAKFATGSTTLPQVCQGLDTLTLWEMQHVWAPTAHAVYTPPVGYDVNTTKPSDLCRGTCGSVGVGQCWLTGVTSPWCGTAASASQDQEVAQIWPAPPTGFAFSEASRMSSGHVVQSLIV